MQSPAECQLQMRKKSELAAIDGIDIQRHVVGCQFKGIRTVAAIDQSEGHRHVVSCQLRNNPT